MYTVTNLGVGDGGGVEGLSEMPDIGEPPHILSRPPGDKTVCHSLPCPVSDDLISLVSPLNHDVAVSLTPPNH